MIGRDSNIRVKCVSKCERSKVLNVIYLRERTFYQSFINSSFYKHNISVAPVDLRCNVAFSQGTTAGTNAKGIFIV